VAAFLAELNRFQLAALQRNAMKAKARKRYVLGFHEVIKKLKINKIKMVIVAPDLEPNNLDCKSLVLLGEGKCRHTLSTGCPSHFIPTHPPDVSLPSLQGGPDHMLKQLLDLVPDEAPVFFALKYVALHHPKL
jgi:hypothetical protein